MARSNDAGTILRAKFAGGCVDCGAEIHVGNMIRWNGTAHCYPACIPLAKDIVTTSAIAATGVAREPDEIDFDALIQREERDEEMRVTEYKTWRDDPERLAADIDEHRNNAYWERLDNYRELGYDPNGGSYEDDVPDPMNNRSYDSDDYGDEEPKNPPVVAVTDGKYTVVMEGEHHTFRVRTQGETAEFAPGSRIIAYLFKPDNTAEGSYKRFAFLGTDGRVRLWKSFNGDSPLARAARVLEDPEGAAKAGIAYALASGRCYRCGLELTHPRSIREGLGPECRKYVFGA
jgi:hypothetical protein